MRTIKNSEELAKLLDKNKDLHLENEDVRIEFQTGNSELNNVSELNDVYCRDLFLMNFGGRFNFTGRDFRGRDFTGGDFTGRDFNGWNFNGWNFKGRNFLGRDVNGWNFKGKKVLYWAFFNCIGNIVCDSISGRREKHAKPVSLDGKIEIKDKKNR